MSDLHLTTATFARGTSLKLSFVALGVADLLLTLYALGAGYVELNPVFQSVQERPGGLFLLKVAVPAAIAWLALAKLLLPSIAFLCVVLGWNAGTLLALS